MNKNRYARKPSPGRALAICALAVALAGCSTVQRAAGSRATPEPQQGPDRRSQQLVQQAIADLNRGDPVAARRRLMTALQRQPNDAVARQFITQIDTDPVQLLGRENYSYTLRDGETLSMVAGRLLSNPLMFFALARYNNITVPTSVTPGQTILIPGHRPAPPAPPPAPRQPPRATPPAASQPRPSAPAAAQPPAQRPANPAAAARLRGQGLAAMSAGAINRAVALLRQALSLDPNNALIRNDLARALRIQGTVRAR